MAHMLHWLALCFVVAGASNDVITMTDHDFFRHTGTHEVMLVDFMSPWCVRCQQMAPSFAAAATALLKTNATVRFGEMDGSANPEIVKHFGVRTYPSLLIFVHGHAFPFDYTGVPNSKGFVEEMSHWQVPTDYVRTLTDDNLDDFVSHSDLMMVEFCKCPCALTSLCLSK
jgi:thiol-disulfide isomerase/thioredoxin